MHSLALAESSVCCTAGWAWRRRREKEGFLLREKEGFLEVRLCIYVLFECKPLVGAAWGFRQYDVSRSYRLCQDNSSTSSGCDGTQRSTEPPYLCVLLFQGVSHTLSHLNIRAWHNLTCPQVFDISKQSWQIRFMVRGQAGYCRPWQVAVVPVFTQLNPAYSTSQITNALTYSSQITLYTNSTEFCNVSYIHFSVFEA